MECDCRRKVTAAALATSDGGEDSNRAVATLDLTTAASDAEIVDRVRKGDTALFEILMRRHNQRVYRVARAVVRDEAEAEDVMQQAYISAFTHLQQFEDRARFSTWLTRITVHEALSRRRKQRPEEPLPETDRDSGGRPLDTFAATAPDPERQAYASELRRVLETAVDSLPEAYRTVFMLRDIEGLSTSETAEGLELGDEAVKTRLHRARAMVRRAVAALIGGAAPGAFEFHAVRCDRVVAAVLARIR
jgi:RNA polymerase sigma-70 factor (ECF subfamily)